jgi:hypothetical protein
VGDATHIILLDVWSVFVAVRGNLVTMMTAEGMTAAVTITEVTQPTLTKPTRNTFGLFFWSFYLSVSFSLFLSLSVSFSLFLSLSLSLHMCAFLTCVCVYLEDFFWRIERYFVSSFNQMIVAEVPEAVTAMTRVTVLTAAAALAAAVVVDVTAIVTVAAAQAAAAVAAAAGKTGGAGGGLERGLSMRCWLLGAFFVVG